MEIQSAYQQFLTVASQHHSAREAQHIARIVLQDIFNISNPNIQGEIADEFIQDICQRLAANEPVQYITGVAFFYELPFYVNQNVLIPRPETEELVYHILNDSLLARENIRVLDIGTGSGCIPISMARQRPSWDISATDVSMDALAVATQNDRQHNTGVTFIHHDILDRSTWGLLPQVDVIVSNPPYIMKSEKAVMPKHVLNWEPHLALFSSGSALLFYETIADFATSHLAANGLIYFEINEFHGGATRDMLLEKGFTDVKIIKDMSGKERMIRVG